MGAATPDSAVPVLIGLGSNLGDRAATLQAAIARLRTHPQIFQVIASSFFATAPVGGPAEQPEFLNAAACLQTTLSPGELLQLLQLVEHEFGRKRVVHWGPRTLDLDILLYGAAVLDLPDLKIPHPLLAQRRFVLEPAAEVAADMRHPVLDKTIAELLAELPE